MPANDLPTCRSNRRSGSYKQQSLSELLLVVQLESRRMRLETLLRPKSKISTFSSSYLFKTNYCVSRVDLQYFASSKLLLSVALELAFVMLKTIKIKFHIHAVVRYVELHFYAASR